MPLGYCLENAGAHPNEPVLSGQKYARQQNAKQRTRTRSKSAFGPKIRPDRRRNFRSAPAGCNLLFIPLSFLIAISFLPEDKPAANYAKHIKILFDV
jgi:hypothetical protein